MNDNHKRGKTKRLQRSPRKVEIFYLRSMQIRSKAYAQMHIATFLWGVTAILGKVITLSEFPLVWYRMMLVTGCMLFIPPLYQQLKRLHLKDIRVMGMIGILVALHWLAWYGSIKYANASVAVSCIALIALITAFIEPLLTDAPFRRSNILLGLLVIPGILLINQSLDLHYKFGFFLGIVAAILAALFTTLNKKYTQHIGSYAITFTELGIGWIFLCALLPLYIKHFPGNFHNPGGHDWFYLLILSILCTIIPYNLFLKALKVSDAFTTSLINNLEPVYGIILAAIFLSENTELNWQFYLGTIVILAAVFLHAFLQSRKKTAAAPMIKED
jgi:drug/metabolite transporter (DMT)-like permease